MQEGYWVIRTYEAGDIGEKNKYYVPGKRPDKLRRKDKRLAAKQEKNSSSAVKTLARLLNANCRKGSEWYMIGLDYSEAGMQKILSWGRENGLPIDSEDEEERQNALLDAADHEMGLAIRRAKRKLGKDCQLKGLYITSDMDGETGEIVRVHHHMIVSAEALEAFRESWQGLGGVDYKHLYENQKDRTPIAEYWIRQVRRRPDAKKYRTTRNLIRPQPKDKIALSNAELRVPKGGELLFRQEFRKGGDQYIRYLMPKVKPGRTDRPPEG